MKYKEFQQLISTELPVLVEFYAEWCAPCKTMQPVIRELKEHYGIQIKILPIDVDKEREIAERLHIFSVPTLIVFRNGQVKRKVAGARSKRELQQMMDKELGILPVKKKSNRFKALFSLFKR